jgi:signal transduction histidine kinase
MSAEDENASPLNDELLATVAHELRTPLTAIVGWTRVLRCKDLNDAEAAHALGALDRNASTLSHLIEDLLDVSRIAKGTLRLTTRPVSLNLVAQAALDTLRPQAEAKRITLSLGAGTAGAVVIGDAGRLEQAIVNLLENAVKFTPPGGRVEVAITSANGDMEVSVADSGSGISPDFLPHVFERFRQANDGTTQRRTGLGLGLAIVQQLVELHGGTVRAASAGLGLGATFTIRLPIR